MADMESGDIRHPSLHKLKRVAEQYDWQRYWSKKTGQANQTMREFYGAVYDLLTQALETVYDAPFDDVAIENLDFMCYHMLREDKTLLEYIRRRRPHLALEKSEGDEFLAVWSFVTFSVNRWMSGN